MTVEERAMQVLKDAHDIIKGESSFKTAQRVTYCGREHWSAIGMAEEHVQGDPETEDRSYVDLVFEDPKEVGRQALSDLESLPQLRDRDLIEVDGNRIRITVIGEPHSSSNSGAGDQDD